jgi:glycosyltransferase involved in cell wall biosynthesis
MFPEKITLTIVIPIYNEVDNIAELFKRLERMRQDMLEKAVIELIFVNDGSSDGSYEMLVRLSEQHKHVKIISFSRNFGHQIAITAGIDYASGGYVAVIDGDLQDPPELIEDMCRVAAQGYDVVYGKRRNRKGETWFKKGSAALFYRILSYLCDVEIPVDSGDFRLMSRRAVDALKSLREQHRFVRGMVPWVGFKSTALDYDRDARYAGETKYPLRKMLGFAANAMLSFSKKPLTVATRLGAFTVLAGIIGGLYMLYLKLFTSIPVPGITAILVTMVIFGGVQILLIGVTGEYIGRIFDEVKRRPLYIVEETRNL